MTTDEKYMKEAIRQAKKAAAIGEVPIGCIIVMKTRSSAGATIAGWSIIRFWLMRRFWP